MSDGGKMRWYRSIEHLNGYSLLPFLFLVVLHATEVSVWVKENHFRPTKWILFRVIRPNDPFWRRWFRIHFVFFFHNSLMLFAPTIGRSVIWSRTKRIVKQEILISGSEIIGWRETSFRRQFFFSFSFVFSQFQDEFVRVFSQIKMSATSRWMSNEKSEKNEWERRERSRVKREKRNVENEICKWNYFQQCLCTLEWWWWSLFQLNSRRFVNLSSKA